MRRLRLLVVALVAASVAPAIASTPAHYAALMPKGWPLRFRISARQFLPPALRGDLRDRARALAAAHDAYLRETQLTIGDAVLDAARLAPSTMRRLDYAGNRVVGGPLVGGRAIADGIVRLIAGARREVILQSFIFEDSWMARQIADAIAKLPAAVKVRVLVHPRRGYAFSKGVGILGENPWRTRRRLRALLPSANVELGVWRVGDLFGTASLHTKGAIVDGERAIVTDSNIQRNVDPVEVGGGGWFQLGMEVDGPIAKALREDALSAWQRAEGPSDAAHLEKSAPPGDTRFILLGKDAASGARSSANLGYGALLLSARDKVRAITPNLNDSAAVLALAAATAHADVYVVLSKGFNEAAQWLFQGGGNARNVRRLRAMAADPNRLHVRWYTLADGRVPVGNSGEPSHAKYASADGKVMILGSQNLDTQSWKRSREVSVAGDDAATTAQFDQVFDGIWARSAIAYEAVDPEASP